MNSRRTRHWAVLFLAMALALFSMTPSPATGDGALDQPLSTGEAGGEREGALDLAAEDGVVRQSPDEALAHDLALVAEAKGWTLAEAAADHLAADRIGEVAEAVARERPDIYVGAALAEEPGGAPRLYVKGPADAYVLDLVAASDIEIVVADNQPFSFDELEARKLRVHRALEAAGFRYIAPSVNVTGRGVVPAGRDRLEGVLAVLQHQPARGDDAGVGDGPLPGLRRADRCLHVLDIVPLLPAGLRGSVQLTVHDQPNVHDEAAFGGMWVRDDGVNECTSGWSVRNLNTGALGVSTAGHCAGINQINHPGHGVHNLNFQSQHRGQWGDVEWHTSPQPEPDDFYADAATIRDVAAVEARGNITVGESVCQYGRSSNDRDCSLDVQDVSQACTNSGVFNNRLVLMNGDTAIGGDSGGGWSFGNTAYGGHKGNCNPDFPNRDAWSVAALFDEAIGVRVTCGC